MKHFFINFLLSIFFILPNWALKVLTLRKEITYKNEVFDYQSMIFISFISWFITKFGLALDMAVFSKDNAVSLRDISLRQGISLLYLEQIFLKLKLLKLRKQRLNPDIKNIGFLETIRH